jgi:PAS domain S-box-containing protein
MRHDTGAAGTARSITEFPKRTHNRRTVICVIAQLGVISRANNRQERVVQQSRESLTQRLAARLRGTRTELAAAAAVSTTGAAFGWWHLRILAGSPGVPAVALLGTGVLFVVSLLLVVAGGWLFSSRVTTLIRTVGWVAVMLAAFGTVGALVSLHLGFMLDGFDSGPLLADLLTVGAAVGFLVGRYDARSLRCHDELHEERTRFVSLFDNIPNPVVHYQLEAGSAVVLDANGVFEEVFGLDIETARGQSLGDLVVSERESLELQQHLEGSGEQMPATAEKQLVTANGLRDFQLITVPYREAEGFSVLVDVTDRKLRTRRLEVLNRVLRHDLRTDAAVISGHADLLAASPEAETIRERALAMAERSADARRIEQALGDSTDRRPLDLTALVEELANDVETATVRTDLRQTMVSGSDALRMAIDELLENAVEHNDTADPTVWISIDDRPADSGDTGQFVTLEIADDGPGLPEMEQTVFETGAETSLQHSNGLGLWIARWVVVDLGGDITVSDRDPRGTVISVRLPRADRSQLAHVPADVGNGSS